MKMRRLGERGPLVSAVGLGCMGMSVGYGATNDAESIATIHRAVDLGVTFFDTADSYGSNEELIGKAIGDIRHRLVIATKCGIVVDNQGRTGRNGRPEHIRARLDRSLKRLGIDVVDLYYLHRVDPDVPVEESMGAFAELVKAGKVRHVGLSEATAEEIRRAHAVQPIAALQSEYSLWTRDPEGEVLDTCRRLGITLVPFAPLGRGFLTGDLQATAFAPGDMRAVQPRLQGENLEKNRLIVAQLKAIARRKGITGAQLALAWVLAQGEDIIPIPGTKRCTYLEDNLKAADVVLTAAELAEIEALGIVKNVAGGRYLRFGSGAGQRA